VRPNSAGAFVHFGADAGFDNITVEVHPCRRPTRIAGLGRAQQFDRRPAQTDHD
jgi:hypothetical protein